MTWPNLHRSGRARIKTSGLLSDISMVYLHACRLPVMFSDNCLGFRHSEGGKSPGLKRLFGNSLAVSGWALLSHCQGSRFDLFGKLRSHKLCSVAKNKEKCVTLGLLW